MAAGPPRSPGGETERTGTRRLLVAGLAGFPLLAAALVQRLSFPLLDALFLAAVVELLPVLAIAQVAMVTGERVERLPAYLTSALSVSLLALFAALLGVRSHGLAGLGLSPLPAAELVLWTGGLGLTAAALVGSFHAVRTRIGIPEGPLLRELLPRTGRERWVFALLSLAAGFGEEIVFRGYALSALSGPLGGPWGAAVFTSFVFGILHAYQGPLGMARVTLLGMALASSVVLSGSLWPAIVVHVFVDLVAGLVLGERLAR